MHTYVHEHTYTYIHICIYIHTHTHIHIRTHILIYIYIYILHLLDAHFTTDFLNSSRAHAEFLRRVVQRQVKVRA